MPPGRPLHILNPNTRFEKEVPAGLELLKGERFVRITRAHPQHMDTIVKWGIGEGFSTFVVWGGDGSLHRLVRCFQETDLWDKAQAGVVPVGSCNDFARHLGLVPGDVPGALRVLRAGSVRKVDVGSVRFRTPERGEEKVLTFINNAGLGRSLRTIERKSGPLGSLLDLQPRSLDISGDGQSFRGTFLMAVICNGPFFSGGLHFARDVSCADGLLDAYFVKPSGPLRLLSRLALGRLGQPLSPRGTQALRASRITLKSEEEFLPQADGETLAEKGVREIEFSVMPGRLSILAPA